MCLDTLKKSEIWLQQREITGYEKIFVIPGFITYTIV